MFENCHCSHLSKTPRWEQPHRYILFRGMYGSFENFQKIIFPGPMVSIPLRYSSNTAPLRRRSRRNHYERTLHTSEVRGPVCVLFLVVSVAKYSTSAASLFVKVDRETSTTARRPRTCCCRTAVICLHDTQNLSTVAM